MVKLVRLEVHADHCNTRDKQRQSKGMRMEAVESIFLSQGETFSSAKEDFMGSMVLKLCWDLNVEDVYWHCGGRGHKQGH